MAQPNQIGEVIRRRLGTREFRRPSDVAVAADVSVDTVRNWITEGCVEAIDIARPGKRRRWRVYVPSVIAFYERQQSGVSGEL